MYTNALSECPALGWAAAVLVFLVAAALLGLSGGSFSTSCIKCQRDGNMMKHTATGIALT